MFAKAKLLPVIPLVLLTLVRSVHAQERSRNIEIKYRQGFIIPHHGYMAYFLSENVNALQLNLGFKTDGRKFWHKEYNYPIVGLGIHHSGLGNDTLYGSLTGVYIFINRNFLGINRRFNVSNSLSVGLAYATKWHDNGQNRVNMVLGTPVNVFFQYEIGITYRLARNHDLSACIGLSHTSNGSVKEPNLGFNIFSSAVGYRYSFGKTYELKSDTPGDKTPLSALNFGLIAGLKSVDAFTGKQYGIFGFSVEKLYRFAPLSMIGLEISAYTDKSISELVSEENGSASANQSSRFALAVNATYTMGFETIDIAFQPGIYLKNQYYGFGGITNKVGLRYKVCQNINLSVAIKAHWFAQADFIEFGVKYLWTRNER